MCDTRQDWLLQEVRLTSVPTAARAVPGKFKVAVLGM